jgi:crossover junction endodeoxyribonuclease RusA
MKFSEYAKQAKQTGEIKLILPYPPSVNHLYATFRGRRITSAVGRRFKSDIAVLAKAQGARILNGDLSVTFRVFRPMRRGDLDNRLKASQDALKGICFADDKQIIEIHAFRFDDRINPRIEIDLKELEQGGKLQTEAEKK